MYREIMMLEPREVLRLRGEGLPKMRIAAQLGLDPKTVRRYLSGAASRPPTDLRKEVVGPQLTLSDTARRTPTASPHLRDD